MQWGNVMQSAALEVHWCKVSTALLMQWMQWSKVLLQWTSQRSTGEGRRYAAGRKHGNKQASNYALLQNCGYCSIILCVLQYCRYCGCSVLLWILWYCRYCGYTATNKLPLLEYCGYSELYCAYCDTVDAQYYCGYCYIVDTADTVDTGQQTSRLPIQYSCIV